MSQRIRSFGSVYVTNAARKANGAKSVLASRTSDREELIDAIASDLGEELDRRGIAVTAFDDDACERFAREIASRYELAGKVNEAST